MGIRTRMFLVEDDNKLWWIPTKRYDRIFEEDSGEVFPEYANQKIRQVCVVLQVENRKPVSILNVLYH